MHRTTNGVLPYGFSQGRSVGRWEPVTAYDSTSVRPYGQNQVRSIGR